MTKGKITDYGFQWGLVDVSRCTEHNGHLIISITTPKRKLHVRVTPGGLIRLDDEPRRVSKKDPLIPT